VRLLILNTPHNPTGRHFDTPTLTSVLELARRGGVRVLVDEAYAGAELDGARTPSAAELDPTAVALGLVSKALGLPGLRIGWLLSRDRELLRAAERVKDYTTICAPAPAEMLATLALRNRERLLTRTRSLLETNAELLADFMARHGRWFVAAPAEAGSICFPRVARGAPLSAPTLCRRAREEAGVLLAPGTHFGTGPPADAPDPVARAFRVGFGRAAFGVGLRRFEAWLAGVEAGGSG
jgi:aspartate/methionine/tyrosine aminotransferase